MPSKAEKTRRRKEQARRQMLERAASGPLLPVEAATPKPVVVAATASRERAAPRDDGLDWLRAKNRITPDQADAGRRYGALYRTAQIESGASMKSCLAALGMVAGGAGDGAAPDALAGAAWITACKRELAAARAALQDDEDLVALLDLVCGRGVRPREISDAQREAEQIETALRVALDLLRRHFRSRRQRHD